MRSSDGHVRRITDIRGPWEVSAQMGGNSLVAIRTCYDIIVAANRMGARETLRGLLPLSILDRLGIYDDEIVRLLDSGCGGNLAHMIVLLLSHAFGWIKREEIQALRCGGSIDFDVLSEKVRKLMPGLKTNPVLYGTDPMAN